MSSGVLWVKITDSDGEVEIDDLTMTGVGMAIFDCQRLIEKLEERADAIREQDEPRDEE